MNGLLSPRKTREAIVQYLFSFECGSCDQDLIPFLMQQLKISRSLLSAAFHTAESIWQAQERLDQVLKTVSFSYHWDRIGKIEKSILRLGLYEILEQKLSLEIVISEALRLTSKFSTPEGAHFVHAILDQIYKNSGENTALSPSQSGTLS